MLQAEKESGHTVEEAGTWFSNPSKSHSQQAVGSGVGKYMSIPKRSKPTPDSPIVAAEGSAAQPAKKQKTAAGNGFGNFDSW